MATFELTPASRVEILTLMDNHADLMLPTTDRMRRAPRMRADGSPAEPPLAGHGFSVLVETIEAGEQHRVLMDAGFPVPGVLHNWKVLGFDPDTVERVMLSHGHVDHFAALGEFLKARTRPVEFIVHPAAFRKRALVLDNDVLLEMEPLPPAETLTAMGAAVNSTADPVRLTGAMITTGQVDRKTDFEKPFGAARTFEDGQWKADLFPDDQALVVNLENRGLVVISGCAHAGIVNTVQHGVALTGATRVCAVVGGFHLSGMTNDQVEATITALKEYEPDLVVPTHCTGFHASAAFARRMGEAFGLNAVGTRIVLGSG